MKDYDLLGDIKGKIEYYVLFEDCALPFPKEAAAQLRGVDMVWEAHKNAKYPTFVRSVSFKGLIDLYEVSTLLDILENMIEETMERQANDRS